MTDNSVFKTTVVFTTDYCPSNGGEPEYRAQMLLEEVAKGRALVSAGSVTQESDERATALLKQRKLEADAMQRFIDRVSILERVEFDTQYLVAPAVRVGDSDTGLALYASPSDVKPGRIMLWVSGKDAPYPVDLVQEHMTPLDAAELFASHYRTLRGLRLLGKKESKDRG